MKTKVLALLFFLPFLYSCETVKKKDFEGTWYIKSAKLRPGIQHAFIQFKDGKYNVFWIEGNGVYYCPQRDGTYNHFDEILFFKEDFVSYSIDYQESGYDYVPDEMGLGFLSKRDTSNVRFQAIYLRKHSSTAIFDEQNLTVLLPTTGGQQTSFPVTPTTNDIFLPGPIWNSSKSTMSNPSNEIAL